MENNDINKNDKSKIIMLISLIVVVSILLIGFVFIAVLDFTQESTKSYLKTTTRRTIPSTNTTTNSMTTSTTEEVIMPEDGETTTTTTATTKNNSGGANKTTKTIITSTKIVTSTKTQIVIPSNEYKIATGPTTYPDALDSWEWEVVDLINAERRKNGLNELLVAEDFRRIAEEGADLYYTNGEESAKSYLANYSNLRMFSNLNINAKTLYTNTLNSTKVTTNPYIRYVGVGVLLKDTGLNTYFYVIIYE